MTKTGMPPPTADPATIRSVAEGFNAFTLALYRATPKDSNTVLSPFSVGTALSLVELGARGDSAKAMHKLLGAESAEGHRTGLRALIYQLEGGGPAIMKHADKIHPHALKARNSLWVAHNYQLAPTFLQAANEHYQALVREVDVSKPSEAAEHVNSWVSKATEEKINDIVTPQSFNDLTRLILVNAVHFVGRWCEPFPEQNTSDAPFHVNGGRKAVNVPTMKQDHFFNALEDDEVMIAELPYGAASADARLVMTIVVPKMIAGLESVESKLSPEVLQGWLQDLESQRVQVSLPRWKAETTADLGGVLPGMGIADLFSEKADLSGISAEKGLHLSGVMHKAFIEVDEKGTEAAAATAFMLLGCSAMPKKSIEFRADRPFLYFIRETKSGTILFVGRVSDPQ